MLEVFFTLFIGFFLSFLLIYLFTNLLTYLVWDFWVKYPLIAHHCLHIPEISLLSWLLLTRKTYKQYSAPKRICFKHIRALVFYWTLLINKQIQAQYLSLELPLLTLNRHMLAERPKNCKKIADTVSGNKTIWLYSMLTIVS